MNVLLTGITGNLGYEVAQDLLTRDIGIIALTRSTKNDWYTKNYIQLVGTLEHDLTNDTEIEFAGHIDVIVHCAGVVRFTDTETANEKMMTKLITLARRLSVPIYFVSTAFVYKKTDEIGFHNAYEKDKSQSEAVLEESGIPFAIFRPSVLVGNSETGAIQNLSGFSTLVNALRKGVGEARLHNRMLRFPLVHGISDMIPVDQAAECIGKIVQDAALGTYFITNPNPPKASWVFQEIVDYFSLGGTISIVDESFEDFKQRDLSHEEKSLYSLSMHFFPYLSLREPFPSTVIAENSIDHTYLTKVFEYLETHTL